MAKFVIHKIGFFFTDESLIELPYEAVKGSVVQIFENLEDAKNEKAKQDILSVQKLHGSDVKQFFFDYENYDKILESLILYYKSEFDLGIQKNDHFVFPENLSDEQAKKILEIIGLTFHNIVEYKENDNSYDKKDKDFDQQEF